MSAEFDTMTAAELRRRIDVSPVELTQRAIDKAQASPATLNVFPMPELRCHLPHRQGRSRSRIH